VYLCGQPANKKEEKFSMAIDPMNGMIAAYLASPKGREAIQNYLSSSEGQKTICDYIATPQGKKTVEQILPCILDALSLSPENRAIVLESIRNRN
jgi:hypothetical protein